MHKDDDKLPPLDETTSPRAPVHANDDHDRTTLFALPVRNEPEPAEVHAPAVASIEAPPAVNPATPAAPREPTVSPSARQPAPRATVPLLSRWTQNLSPPPQRTRTIPRGAKLAALVALALLSVIASRSCLRGQDAPPEQARIIDAPIVNAEDLRNRTEVSPDDFRPRRNHARPTAPRDPAPPIITEEMLRERQARRTEDPNEVTAVRRHRPQPPAEPQPVSVAPPPPAPRYRRSTMHLQPENAARVDDRAPDLLLPTVGQSIPAVIQGTAQITGTTTIIAVVDRPGLVLPEGTRFLGVASLHGYRVSVRFRKLILPDGHEARIHAEAQTEDGSFGLPVGAADDDDGRSVEEDIARDTTDDLVGIVLGDNLLTRTTRSYDRRSRHRGRSRRSSAPLVLPAGTPCWVFFHEPPISD